jgi:two-component system, response regulator PdtaR
VSSNWAGTPRSEDRSSPHMPLPNVPESNPLAGKRVVIVEDEGMTQIHLQRMLTHLGLVVAGTARTGAEAVAVVLRERPDVVLMDIKMPGDIDGLEATRQILTQLPVCILVVTAYIEHRSEAEQIGAAGYILKPIHSAALLSNMEAAWEKWRMRNA